MKKEPNPSLLKKYLCGNASFEERKQVEQWYQELSFQNKITDFQQDQESVWSSIQAATVKPKSYKFLKYAALLIGLISCSLLILLYQQQDKAATLSLNSIEAGGNRAMLFVGTDSISLTDLDSGAVAIRNNIKITKLADGSIAYESLAGSKDNAWNKLSTPQGGQFKIILADGSIVMLNAASSLEFPSQFSGQTRKVKLQGEAFFEVSHNANQPFIVENQLQTVTVLGTKFNIKAYENNKLITSLIEGKVEVATASGKITLLPGEQAINSSGDLSHLKVFTKATTAWKEGRLAFEREPLSEIMAKVARWYNIEVVFEDEALKEKSFTGSIPRNRPLNELLQVLTMTGEVQFKLDKQQLIISTN